MYLHKKETIMRTEIFSSYRFLIINSLMKTVIFLGFLLLMAFTVHADDSFLDTDNDGLTDEKEVMSFSSEFQVNTYTSGNQYYPCIASSGSNYCVLWYGRGEYGEGDDIYAQMIDNDGNTIGQNFIVNTYISGNQSSVNIASDGLNYLAVWDSSEISAQLLNASGEKIGTEFQVNSYTTANQYSPVVNSNGSSYLVLWSSSGQDGSDYGIFGRLMDNEGQFLSDDFQVNTYTTANQSRPKITVYDEKYLVSWRDISNDNAGVYAQWIDNDGNLEGIPFRITSDRSYSLESNGSSIVFVWDGIYGILLDNDGSRIDREFLINTYTTNSQIDFDVASDGNNYLVSWSSANQDGSSWGVYGQLLNTSARRIGGEFRINSYTTSNQSLPELASDGKNYLVCWQSENQDGSGWGVYAKLVNWGYSTNPAVSDTDGDGVSDGDEALSYMTIPNDADSDKDGLSDGDEILVYHSDPLKPDTDGDGMDDQWEASHNLNPRFNDTDYDNDGDTLTNIREYFYMTDPFSSDTDNDGYLDQFEVANITSPTLKMTDPDTDNDGLTDSEEITQGTDPDDPDSDNDGLLDGQEIFLTYPEQKINSHTLHDQKDPMVMSNGNGYLISWVSFDQEVLYRPGESSSIYARYLDNYGNFFSREFRVNNYTPGDQGASSSDSYGRKLDIDSMDGNYIITWQGSALNGYSWDISGRLFDYQGNTIRSDFIINTYTADQQLLPSIANNGSTYLLAWYDIEWYGVGREGSNSGIFGALLDNDCNVIVDDFQINTYTTSYQIDPAVISVGENYLVTWSSDLQDGSEYGIFAQMLDNEGSFIGSEFQVNEFRSRNQSDPSVASVNNCALIVWSTHDTTYHAHIYGRMIDSNGNLISREFAINSTENYSCGEPSVFSDGRNFLVVWKVHHDGHYEGVEAQLIDNKGRKIGSKFRVNDNFLNEQSAPRVSSNGKTYMVCWRSEEQDGSGFGVYAKLINWGYGTDPLNADTDNDGISDGDEINLYNTIPTETDSDFDSLTDYDEVFLYQTDPNKIDTDSDNIDDTWEISRGLNPCFNDADFDNDGDTVTNIREFFYQTDPFNPDTDNDGDNDGLEVINATNPTVNDVDSDTDNDGLTDSEEMTQGTDPTDPDSDNDGLLDGKEVFLMYPEKLINSYTTSEQSEQFIESNGNGYLITWTSDKHENSLSDTRFQNVNGRFLDKQGEFVSKEFRISESVIYGRRDSAIASLNGSYLVSWRGGLYGQLFDYQGNKLGTKINLNSDTQQSEYSPYLTSNRTNYLVTWANYNHFQGADYDIFARILDTDLTGITSDFLLNTYTTSTQGGNVTAAVGNKYVVTWVSNEQDGSSYGIFAKLLDNDGTPLTPDIQVNQYVWDIQQSPAIASNGEQVLIVWETRDGGTSYNVFARLMDSNGNFIGDEFNIDDLAYVYSRQSKNPVVSSNGDDFLVVWDENIIHEEEVLGQFIDSRGRKIGDSFVINDNTLYEQSNPEIACDGTNYMVCWQSDKKGSIEFDVYAKLIKHGYGTDPLNSDTDNDGISDGDEINIYDTLPTQRDTDGDTLSDGDEIVYGTNPNNQDTDNDGMNDDWEISKGLNPLFNDSDIDNDGDLLTNGREYFYMTDPLKIDTDNDGMSDGYEIIHNTNPTVKVGDFDSDNDGLKDSEEVALGTDPNNFDSDNDGLSDGKELFTMSGEFQINSYTISSQYGPSITTNGANYFVSWTSYGQELPLYSDEREGIFGRFVDMDGNMLSREIAINSYVLHSQERASVASMGNTFCAAWYSIGQGTKIQLFNIFGDRIGDDFHLSGGVLPVIASNGQNYMVAMHYNYPNYDIGVKIMDNEGTVCSSFIANSYTADSQSGPYVTAVGNNYLICWSSYASEANGQDGDDSGIFARIVDNEGTYLTDEFQVNTYTSGKQSYVASSCNGETCLIVWHSSRNGTSQYYDIHARLMDNEGNFLGDEFQVNTYHNNEQKLPTVYSCGGTFLVAWQSQGQDVSGWGVYGQLIDYRGRKIGEEFCINHRTSGDQRLTSNDNTYNISGDGDNYIVCWQSQNQDGSSWGIFSRLINWGYGTDPLVADTDGDGLNDGDEINIYETNPNSNDTDEDGLNDKAEIDINLNPLVSDAYDDTDNDGLINIKEVFYKSNPFLFDTDNDGMSDGYEVAHLTNPIIPPVQKIDTDNDGLSDDDEFILGSDINLTDTDNDGLSDYFDHPNFAGLEIQVNETISGDQWFDSICKSDTGYLVTWHGPAGYDNGETEIFGRLYDMQFTPVLPEFQINTYTDDVQTYSSCASDGVNYLVAWISSIDNKFWAYGQMLDKYGNKIGPEFFIDEIFNNHTPVYVVSNGSTYFVVYNNSHCEVYGKLYDNEGNIIKGKQQINSYMESFQYNASVISEGENYFVVWESVDQDGDGSGVYGRLYDNEAVPLTGEILLNIDEQYHNQSNVQAASNGDSYFVVWESYNGDNSLGGIKGIYLDNDGNILGNEILVNTYTSGGQRWPSVASDGTDYFVTWTSQAYQNSGIFGQTLDDNGRKIGEEFKLDSGGSYSLVLSSEKDHYFVAWTAQDSDGLGVNSVKVKIGYGTEPLISDTDNDGVSDGDEIYLYNIDPLNFDTDEDGIPDGDELDVYETDPASVDSDSDGLSDFEEIVQGIDPNNADSDNDGLIDGREQFEVSQEIAINTYTANDQINPFVASNGNGYFVCWSGFEQPNVLLDCDGYGVYGRYLDESGNGIGRERLINTYTVGNQGTPSGYTSRQISVSNIDDNYLVAWMSYEQDGDREGLFAQFVDYQGIKKGSEFQINEYTTGSQGAPSIASNGSTYLIAWNDNIKEGSAYGVFAKMLDNGGNVLLGDFQVNTYTTDDQYWPSVACLGDKYVVVWHSQDQDGSDYGIYGRLIDNDGSFAGPEFLVNSHTPRKQYRPSIASNGEKCIVVWSSLKMEYNNTQVYGRFIDSDGTVTGPEFLISPSFTGYGDQGVIQQTVASNGENFFVIWRSNAEVYGQLIDPMGRKIGQCVRLNDYTAGEQSYPSIASDGNTYFACWFSFGQDGSGDGIFGKVINWGYGTNPSVADTDNDGIKDGDEINVYFTIPTNPDTDGDSILDSEEILTYQTNPNNMDTDNDGINDDWEINNGLNPLVNDADYDNDNDLLTNAQEYLYMTDPLESDTDNDGDNDGYEIIHNTNPTVKIVDFDSDNDGLKDSEEIAHGTAPNNSDSDNDGLLDGQEILLIYDEFQINTYTTNQQRNPTVASDGSKYFVCWASFEQADTFYEGYAYDMYGKCFDGNAAPLTKEFLINTYTVSNQGSYHIDWSGRGSALGSNGVNFLAVWESFSQTTSGHWSVHGQFFDNYIQRKGPEFQLNVSRDNSKTNPVISSNGETYLIAWRDSDQTSDGSGAAVSGVILDNEGNLIKSDFVINTYTSSNQYEISITTLEDRYLVFWRSNLQDGSKYGVYGQILDNEGTFIGSEFQVNEYFEDEQIYPAAASSTDRTLIVWTNSDTQYCAHIFGRIIDRNGNFITQDFAVSPLADYSCGSPSVYSNGRNFLVVWQNNGQDGSGRGTYAQFIDCNGRKIGSEFKVNDYVIDEQARLSVTGNGETYMVCWRSYGQDGSEFGIFGKLINSGYGTNPSVPDSDTDGIKDGDEINVYYTIPTNPDTDGDSILDGEEILIYQTDPNSMDTDNDGMNDDWELSKGLNPLLNDADIDNDGDLLTNSQEYFYMTDPLEIDTDNDGDNDGYEIINNTSPTLKVTDFDSDNDGLKDSEEIIKGTDPDNPDSDNDGLLDGEEVFTGSDEFLANLYTLSSQDSPCVISNGMNYFVLWSSFDQENLHFTGDRNGIFGRLFDMEGNPLTREIAVNSYTLHNQDYVSACSDGTNYFVVWASYGQNGTERSIYAQLFDELGNKRGDEILVNSESGFIQNWPVTATNGNNYIVLWHASYNPDGDGSGVYGRIIDNEGILSGDEFIVNSYTTSSQNTTAVTAVENNYIVCWNSSGQDGDSSGIFARIIDNEGTYLTDEIQINNYTIGRQGDSAVIYNGETCLIVWSGCAYTSGSHEIYGRFIDNEGNLLGDEFQINTYTTNSQASPTIFFNGKNYLIAWQSMHQDTSNWGVYGQLIDSLGRKIGTELKINITSAKDQCFVGNMGYDRNSYNISGDDDTYVVCWESDGQDGSDRGIYYRLLHWGYGTDPLVADTDGDGLNDGEEVNIYETDPKINDTDGDGLDDKSEIDSNLNPLLSDSYEDTDNDGLVNIKEVFYQTDPFNSDTDNDGMTDGYEVANLSNPILPPVLASTDTDNDGLSDDDEYILGSDINLADTDNDGLSDYFDHPNLTGLEIRVNETTEGSQIFNSITKSDTGYLVTWYGPGNYENGETEIFSRLYDKEFTPICPEFQVNTWTEDIQQVSCSASDGSNYMVIWRSFNQGSYNRSIRGQYLDKYGTKTGSEFLIDGRTDDGVAKGFFVASNRLSYFVVYDYDSDIYGTLYDNEGNVLKDKQRINTHTDDIQKIPSVISNGENYLVVWQSNNQDGNNYGAYGRLYDNEGNALTGEIFLNIDFQYSAQLIVKAASNGRNYLVVWESARGDGDNYGIRGIYLDNEGSVIGNEIIVNTYMSDDQSSPFVNSDGENYFVAWRSEDQDGSGWGVYGQLLDDSGMRIGEEFRLNSYTNGDQYGWDMVSDGDKYIALWSSNGQDGSSYGVYGTKIIWGYGTSPTNTDTDNDGLFDGDEVNSHITNPLLADTDKDGLNDEEEVNIYQTNPKANDTDGDGVDDKSEIDSNLNPLLTDSYEDTDNDGLVNIKEVFYQTDPFNSDTDNDGMSDGYEVANVSSPVLPPVLESIDTDNDGLSDDDEYILGSNINVSDTDNDGLSDYFDHPNLTGLEIRVNETTEGSQIFNSICKSDTGYLVTWQGPAGYENGETEIFCRLYDKEFTPIAPEFQVNTCTFNIQDGSRSASDGKKLSCYMG